VRQARRERSGAAPDPAPEEKEDRRGGLNGKQNPRKNMLHFKHILDVEVEIIGNQIDGQPTAQEEKGDDKKRPILEHYHQVSEILEDPLLVGVFLHQRKRERGGESESDSSIQQQKRSSVHFSPECVTFFGMYRSLLVKKVTHGGKTIIVPNTIALIV